MSTRAVEWPPEPNDAGNRWWLARCHPDLKDGIYTENALRSRGVDPDQVAATGLLQGWKTPEPALRRPLETGSEQTTIFFW